MATRYRLRPDLTVLRRPTGTVQVGLDVADQLLLPAAPPGAEGALRTLRHGRTLAEVGADWPGVGGAWLRDAVAALAEAGLVHARRPAAPVVVVGEGVLAEAVSRALVGPEVVLRRAAQWESEAHPGHLVIVCQDAIEPDRVQLRLLTQAGRPHLVVRAEPERAVVGPFVTAGGPCVTCTDLVRRDLDPAWPLLLVQLCRVEHVPRPAQAAWIAGMVSAQVGAWAAGATPDTFASTLELGAADGALGHRRWPERPDCAAHLAGMPLAA